MVTAHVDQDALTKATLPNLGAELEVISRAPAERTHVTPLLFVHGGCHAAWCWDVHFLSYFARLGYVTYALSLRGHGQSTGRLALASIGDYVRDVEQVMEALAEKPVLIAHSMGGLVVQKYLERHQDIPACVLMASSPVGGFKRALQGFVLKHVGLLELLRFDVKAMLGANGLAHEAFFSSDMPEAEVQSYLDRMNAESVVASLGALFNLPRAHLIKTPMLVLGGRRDKLIDEVDLKTTAQAYHTEAVIFDTAHDMMLEEGWEAVASGIRDWLEVRGL